MGNFPQAQVLYEQALAMAQDIGNRASEGRLLTNLGLLDRQAGELGLAKQRYETALIVLEEIGDRASMSGTLNSLGQVQRSLGNDEAALASYERGIAIALDIGDRLQQGNLSDSLGGLHYQRAHYGKALAAYEQALTTHQQIGNLSGEATALNNLGGIYTALGQYEVALSYFEQAIAIDDPLTKAGILAAQGGVYQLLNRFPEALEATQQGLQVSKIVGDRPLQSRLLDQLGSLYAQAGQVAPAVSAYTSALEVAQTSGDLSAVGSAFNNLANLAVQQNQIEQAHCYFQQALSIFQQSNDRRGESVVFGNLGQLYEASEQPTLAILFYKQAVNQHEAVRGRLRSLSDALQQSYTDSTAAIYRRLANLLLQQDRVLEAQRVVDLLKVQEVDDYVRGVRSNEDTQAGVDMLASETEIWAAYSDLNEKAIVIAQGLERLRQLQRPLTSAEIEQKAVLDQWQRAVVKQFRAFSDRDDIVRYTESLSRTAREQSLSLSRLSDFSQNLSELEQSTVLLYPLILEDRLELILVAPGVPPIYKTVDVDRVSLNTAIQQFRSALASPNQDPLAEAQQLYDWLIRPIESQLTQAQAKTLLYAPDGSLRYVPLSALHNGDTWLIEQYQINNITAASIDDFTRQPTTADRRILAGAFSDVNTRHEISDGGQTLGFNGLPFAGTEVEALQALQPNSTAYFNPDFSKNSILPNMDDYAIVHLATHAAFLPGSPLDSFVLLGNGETITLQEVKDEWFFSNLDLIVLSACQTGLSSVGERGEEILGFGYLMQNAGVGAAIASLWAVADGGTQRLMSSFYTGLLKADMSKAEALRQAQLTLINSEISSGGIATPPSDRGFAPASQRSRDGAQSLNQFSHPYYWSPFILIGNGL